MILSWFTILLKIKLIWKYPINFVHVSKQTYQLVYCEIIWKNIVMSLVEKSLNLSDDFFCTNHQPASILHIFHQNYFVCISIPLVLMYYSLTVCHIHMYPHIK